MRKKTELGFSLLEMMIGVAILGMIASMVSQYFVRSERSAKQISVASDGHLQLTQLLQKIRRQMSMRDASGVYAVTPTSLQFTLPADNVGATRFDLTMETKCRRLPQGQRRTQPTAALGLDCLQQSGCGAHEVPYIETTFQNSVPAKNAEELPSEANFTEALKQTFTTAGLALCFVQSANTLLIKGLAVQMQKIEEREWTSTLREESISLPVTKRNNVDIMP